MLLCGKLYRHPVNFIFSRICSTCTETANFADVRYSNEEVDEIINSGAISVKLNSNKVSYFHANQLGVNRPIEDRWNAGVVDVSNYNSAAVPVKNSQHQTVIDGHLFSVVDGHSGHACAHTVNACHMEYVAAAMLVNNFNILQEYLQYLEENQFVTLTQTFLPRGGLSGDIPTSVRESHIVHLKKYINELLSTGFESEEPCRSTAFYQSLSRLDEDMLSAALPKQDLVNRPLLRAVSSGCVGSFVYIPESADNNIYFAQVGDCGIVHGSRSTEPSVSGSNWASSLIVPPHNYQNEQEVERIIQAHPINETINLIFENRLLGELVPLRAFGDVRFKWQAKHLQKVASLLGLSPSYPVTPRFYKTPPYLTATPEVRQMIHPSVSAKSKAENAVNDFIIIASDGLWDCLTPQEAADVVGAWCDSRHEENVASILIKRALGGINLNYEDLAHLLAMPGNVGRYYRDDITVVVVFLK